MPSKMMSSSSLNQSEERLYALLTRYKGKGSGCEQDGCNEDEGAIHAADTIATAATVNANTTVDGFTAVDTSKLRADVSTFLTDANEKQSTIGVDKNNRQCQRQNGAQGQEGVILLFYKYVVCGVHNTSRDDETSSPQNKRRKSDGKQRAHAASVSEVVDTETFASWQREVCRALRLTGRIRVSAEGINGTIGGMRIAAELYKQAMESIPMFRGIDWKESVMRGKDDNVVDGSRAFPTLHVKAVPEICALGVAPEKLQAHMGGRHVSPEEWHRMLLLKNQAADKERKMGESDGNCGSKKTPGNNDTSKEYVLLDCRNWYESCIGRFEGATQLATRHFTEFPMVADRIISNIKQKEAEHESHEQPTGGIRCERASAYLRCNGIKDVVQLSGGIHRYIDIYGTKRQQQDQEEQTAAVAAIDITVNSHKLANKSTQSMFKGKNFVFDRRHAIGDQKWGNMQARPQSSEAAAPAVVVGRCRRCDIPWDTYDKRWKCDKCNVMVLLCPCCAKIRDTQEISRRRAKKRARKQKWKEKQTQQNNEEEEADKKRKIASTNLSSDLDLVDKTTAKYQEQHQQIKCKEETSEKTMQQKQRYTVPLLLCELCSEKRRETRVVAAQE